MDQLPLSPKPVPISKIVFIVAAVLVVFYCLWKWCLPSSPAASSTPLKSKTQEETEAEVEHNPPTRTSEYESFMDRLQKGEMEARKRALALAEEEKKARAAEEASRHAKEMERVKHHTQPVGKIGE